jgi:hypothetical protein
VQATASNASGVANALAGAILFFDVRQAPILHTTVARNRVAASGDTHLAQGGGLHVFNSGVELEGSILALNSSSGQAKNCFGDVTSAGHNLLGTAAGCTFSKKPTDQINKDPKLGLLASNGGPTRTLALLNGSPAINKIPTSECRVQFDQRGVKRPQGPACDEGSFERKPS